MPSRIQELDDHLSGRMSEFGITRLADTSGLDRLDIRTCSCVKPDTADAIWVYSGKGHTRPQARVSAIMECIERSSALWDETRVRHMALNAFDSTDHIWPPARFTEKRRAGRRSSASIAWVRATYLSGAGEVWVPAELVFNGRAPSHLNNVFDVRTSNGLAAGMSREHAIEAALAEVVERDAVSCAEMVASHGPLAYLNEMAKLLGKSSAWLSDHFQPDLRHVPEVARTTLPACLRPLVKRFDDAGVCLSIKAIPNDLGIPVFGAAAWEQDSGTSTLSTAGFGADRDPTIALSRALLEVAQSRATDRQGAREDTDDWEKQRHERPPQSHWLVATSPQVIDFSLLRWSSSRSGRGSAYYSDALSSVGLTDIAVFDFPTYPGLHVVRVLVPGVETWHPTGGNSHLGPRMKRRLRL